MKACPRKFLCMSVSAHLTAVRLIGALQDPVTIVVTGAAGQIAYSLLPSLASGSVFGMDQPVIFHLLDVTPAQTALGGTHTPAHLPLLLRMHSAAHRMT